MKKVFSMIICFIVMASLAGCEASKTVVDEKLLSCVFETKDEVCKVLNLTGDEHYYGKRKDAFPVEDSLVTQAFFNGEEFETILLFDPAQENRLYSIEAEKALDFIGEDAVIYVKEAYEGFTERCGKCSFMWAIPDGNRPYDKKPNYEEWDEELLDNTINLLKDPEKLAELHFVWNNLDFNFGYVECTFAQTSEGFKAFIRITSSKTVFGVYDDHAAAENANGSKSEQSPQS